MYSEAELRALAAVLERHRQVWVLSDDMYEHILFDGRRYATMAQAAPQLAERTLTVNGVSKAYAMTGWRIGYGGGPARPDQGDGGAAVAEHRQSIIDWAGRRSRRPDRTAGYRAQRCAEFERRRDAIGPKLGAIPGLACEMPAGAFYFYVSCAG